MTAPTDVAIPPASRETPASQASGPGEGTPSEQKAGESKPKPIGRDGEPIRAVAFSSGGFDTAMQLGLVHALLTIQGRAPDAVVGVSAGAVNAAALAEILQAGVDPAVALNIDLKSQNKTKLDQELQKSDDDLVQAAKERQGIRVARFRQFLEAYLSAPGELGRAFMLDTLQVESGKPLRPLELPVHHEKERKYREKQVLARQGLINLYNDLLSLRISFSTLTRFVRRALGIQAAGYLQNKPARWVGRIFEIARTWALIGVNLPRAAWLFPHLVYPFFSRPAPTARAATAANIIFTTRWLRSTWRALVYLLNAGLLLLTWTTITVSALLVPYFVVLMLGRGLRWLAEIGLQGINGADYWIRTHSLLVNTASYLAIGVVVVLLLVGSGAWRHIVEFNRTTSGGIMRQVGAEALSLVLVLAVMLSVVLGGSLVAALLYRRGGPPKEVLDLGWRVFQASYLVAVVILALIAIVIGAMFRKSQDRYLTRLLARYDLADGLLSVHPMRELFVRLFDPGYYGERQMDDVVDRALRDDYSPAEQSIERQKLVRHYDAAPGVNPPIAVGLMVANLAGLQPASGVASETGEIIEVVPGETKVVDGLLAATAVTPFFPPIPVKDKLLIDGANIATEAMRGAIELLKERANENSTVVELYSVSHLPFSTPALRHHTRDLPDESVGSCPAPGKNGEREYLRLVDVATRALQLQRFRDATLERRMIELLTKVTLPDRAVTTVKGERYLRAWVNPVEPDEPLDLNHRLLRSSTDEETRGIIRESIADGCRASLETMLQGTFPKGCGSTISCRDAVQGHLGAQQVRWKLPLLATVTLPAAAGAAAPTTGSDGPGLGEICSSCRLTKATRIPGAASNGSAPFPSCTLVVRNWERRSPSWPHEYAYAAATLPASASSQDLAPEIEGEQESLAGHDEFKRTLSSSVDERTDTEKQWPRDRDRTGTGRNRPLVNLLFSGGVFRGVYQLGTLAAISEAELEPDVIAGASVGSITAAMVAQAFALKGKERDAFIARLAATYLAMDRLILTDRFADFVRGVTLRAAASRFSLRQADRVFRRFDQASPAGFNRETRLVTAGLERLFWLSPFELLDLLRAFRLRHSSEVYRLLGDYVQEWLERMGVGNEALGAEPLELIIAEHVLQRLRGEQVFNTHDLPFDRYLAQGIYFLATTTNLTSGKLEVLGSEQIAKNSDHALLLEGLLASSAFPGVFRPRWGWEVIPGSRSRDQYIDGGVMDNLPLDAVARFLHSASLSNLIERRPRVLQHQKLVDVPHLLFSASLEINPEPPTEDDLEHFLVDWPTVWTRARQLKYNKKLELFADTQRALRAVYAATAGASNRVPLDLEVVMVRPRWLCGTFAFHPMLGFRRERQAQSIAHGCATTLLELARKAGDPATAHWATAWGLDPEILPKKPPKTDRDPIVPGKAVEGNCWFRPGKPCPFSAERLKNSGIPEHTRSEVDKIYQACGQPETHQPRSG